MALSLLRESLAEHQLHEGGRLSSLFHIPRGKGAGGCPTTVPWI